MKTATLILSALSFVTSAATLGVVVFGAKKVQAEMDELRERTNKSLNKFKTVINNIEL